MCSQKKVVLQEPSVEKRKEDIIEGMIPIIAIILKIKHTKFTFLSEPLNFESKKSWLHFNFYMKYGKLSKYVCQKA